MISDEQVKTQVEYYLSDGNLEKDSFFYNKILENDLGYINIELILNCNKIKDLAVGKERILQAVKTSDIVEVDEGGNQIRRKGNKALPEAKFKNKKLKVQLKSEKDVQAKTAVETGEAHQEQNGEPEAEDTHFIPLILFIKDTSRLEKVIGREFESKLGEELKIDVPFARIGKYDGNVVFNRSEITQEILERLVTKGFEYEGQKIVFELGNDKDRDEFMRNHGRHVGKIILKSSFGIKKNTKKRWGSLRKIKRRNSRERSSS